MEIRNITKYVLEDTLAKVNEKFGRNIKFKRIDLIGLTKHDACKYRVTLTVESSKGKGAKINAINGRRIHAACWHVHGEFFNNLPKYCEIITSRFRLTSGDTWNDFSVGSLDNPVLFSECCHCED